MKFSKDDFKTYLFEKTLIYNLERYKSILIFLFIHLFYFAVFFISFTSLKNDLIYPILIGNKVIKIEYDLFLS